MLGPANVPKVLVGLKSDLRDDFEKRGQTCVSNAEGKRMKDEYNFSAYIECSAKTRENLTTVFFRAVQVHETMKKIREGQHSDDVLGKDDIKPLNRPSRCDKCTIF